MALIACAACRTAAPTAPASPGVAPSPAAPSVRLLRASVRAADDEATLRLTLRLWSRERFEVVASDLAGRSLWKIEADAQGGRLEDRRERTSCRFEPARPIDLPGLELPLEAGALPDLLLGGRPAALEAAVAVEGDPRRLRDPLGRSWRIDGDEGAMHGWSLLDDEGRVALALRVESGAVRVESPPAKLEVRLRERARSALTTPAPPLAPLDRLPDCRALDLS